MSVACGLLLALFAADRFFHVSLATDEHASGKVTQKSQTASWSAATVYSAPGPANPSLLAAVFVVSTGTRCSDHKNSCEETTPILD